MTMRLRRAYSIVLLVVGDVWDRWGGGAWRENPWVGLCWLGQCGWREEVKRDVHVYRILAYRFLMPVIRACVCLCVRAHVRACVCVTNKQISRCCIHNTSALAIQAQVCPPPLSLVSVTIDN
jgi:hypothetical protein